MVDCVVIVSGGMDSVTLLHYLVRKKRRQPAVLSFVYGQKHAKEVACARQQARLLGCSRHEVVDLSAAAPLFATSALVSPDREIPDVLEVVGDPQPASYVPNRNMVLLALAAAYAEVCGVAEVYYGAQRHDVYGYWDTTPEFVARLNDIYTLNRKTELSIAAPFLAYSKSDILRLGLELGVDYSRTWSCYAGGELACGRCPTCAERRKAFREVGRDDPLPYADAAASEIRA